MAHGGDPVLTSGAPAGDAPAAPPADASSLPAGPPSAAPGAARVLYCVPGAWTDAWYDDPGAWWQWCCAFRGWSVEEWRAFYGRWKTAPDGKRREMMDATGLRFFDWQRVPGGAIRGSALAAADLIARDLDQLPAAADVTLLGHSKGGSALKHLLAARREWRGARPARAIFVDAPIDWLRETAARVMGLGIARCRLDGRACGIPLATVNNWLDPSGGRLRGVRNYQTFLWQDYLQPYPPHGLKGHLAERVLRDVGAIPPPAAPRSAPA